MEYLFFCFAKAAGILFFGPLMASEQNEQPQTQTPSKNPMDLTFTDAEILQRYVTETGKILPRRITGLSAIQQRHITRQIKRARSMLLMK